MKVRPKYCTFAETWGAKNDSWRVTVSMPHFPDYGDGGILSGATLMPLGRAACDCNRLKMDSFGLRDLFLSKPVRVKIWSGQNRSTKDCQSEQRVALFAYCQVYYFCRGVNFCKYPEWTLLHSLINNVQQLFYIQRGGHIGLCCFNKN